MKQNHLRILSGLYGLLKPLDLIAPYRLEMGTKLKSGEINGLYNFWKPELTKKHHHRKSHFHGPKGSQEV